MDTASLIWGLLFSSIGFGYFLYGKKQQRFVMLFCGLALMIYPYFIAHLILLVAIGLLLLALPYFFRE